MFTYFQKLMPNELLIINIYGSFLRYVLLSLENVVFLVFDGSLHPIAYMPGIIKPILDIFFMIRLPLFQRNSQFKNAILFKNIVLYVSELENLSSKLFNTSNIRYS